MAETPWKEGELKGITQHILTKYEISGLSF